MDFFLYFCTRIDMKNAQSVIISLLVCLFAGTMSIRADLRSESLAMVDSAYALAMNGQLPQAVLLNEEGLQAVPEDSMELRCEFYSCLLYCYHRMGDYSRALEYGELCLQYDETQGTQEDLSASLGNLAGIYSSAGQQDVAIEYLERAITIEEGLLATDTSHSPKSLAIRKAMLGEVLLAKSQESRAKSQEASPQPSPEGKGDLLSNALQLTEEALQIEQQLGRRVQEGMRLAQLANIYEALGRNQEAKTYNQQALLIARETGNKMTEVQCLLQLERYEEAAQIAHETGLLKQEYEACDRLYKQSVISHHYAEALQWLERARALHEQLMNEENQRQLTIAQVRYDSFRKEQQLEEQQQQLEQRKRREWILGLFSALVVLVVALLTIVVLLLRKRKNILEQKVLDQEQQYSKLALELKQFYGKDISSLLQEIADAKAKNIQETKLTKREQEIVKLICEGYRGKEIADKLFISLRAVNSHKTNIFNKLGISSSVELVRFAIEHGII